MNDITKNNKAHIIGKVVSEFTFSHEVFGEGFYIANVSIDRLSDKVDVVPIMVSDRMIDVTNDYTGKNIEVSGQFRSYNRHEGVKNKLVLSIFVRELRFIEDEDIPEEQSKSNQIFLDGYVCKPPIYRKTPLGREIADILVAVNRPYGKADYIPCIAWGRNANFVGLLEVGKHIQLQGRIQSREYTKRISEDETEKRIAYEVSVSKVELAEDEEKENADE
jgi:primosomal replication protein N